MDRCKVTTVRRNDDRYSNNNDAESDDSVNEDRSNETSLDSVCFGPTIGDETGSKMSRFPVRDQTDNRALRGEISSELIAINPVTRKKISSTEHSQTFSFADSEDDPHSRRFKGISRSSFADTEEDSTNCRRLRSLFRSSGDKNASTSAKIEGVSKSLPEEKPSTRFPVFDTYLSPHLEIPRNISFNDRIVHDSSEDSLYPPSPQISRPASAPPERLQPINKVDAACGGSVTKQLGRSGKRTIKNLTSSLVRKLSSKAPQKDLDASLSVEMVNGLPSSDTAGIVSYESLLRLFSCPSCDAMMAPPFAQCKKGHLVCETCRVASKNTCPSCKQRVLANPNFMMERVYELVRLPCQFFKLGCLEYHPPKQKTNHEHFCPHRPLHCHFENRGCPVVLALKDIQRHIERCQFTDTTS